MIEELIVEDLNSKKLGNAINQINNFNRKHKIKI